MTDARHARVVDALARLLSVLALGAVAGCGDGGDARDARDARDGGDDSARRGGRDGAAPPGTDGGSDGAFAARWSSKRSLPSPKQELAVVALDGKVYVLGGLESSGRTLADVHVYDPKLDAWTTTAPLPEPLHHVNAAAVGGRVWITGALRGGAFEPTGSVWSFDPASRTWTAKTSMPRGTERGASMVAAIGDVVYVAGGSRGGSVADVSAYDTKTDTWMVLPPLDEALDHGAGAAAFGIFFVLGGRGAGIGGHTAAVRAFDPTTKRWSMRAPMPTSRAGCAAAVAMGRIVVMGGEGNRALPSGVFAEVEAYDPRSDTWEPLPPMQTPRHGTGAAAIGDVIVVPGGGVVEALGATEIVEALSF